MIEEFTYLQEVTVSASSFTTGDKKGVTLSTLDVLKTPGAAADIMWAIQTFPGVQQVEEGAGLFVRGGEASETVSIIDGAYLYHPYKFESHNGGYFGIISPFLTKGISFSSGGYGVEYTNSISGALVMESQGIANKTKTNFNIGLAGVGLRFETPLANEKYGIALSGNYVNAEPMFRLNGHQRKFSKYPFSYDINMNIGYKYTNNSMIKLFFFRELDELGTLIDDPTSKKYYHGKTISNLANLSLNPTCEPPPLFSSVFGRFIFFRWLIG